MVNSNAQRNARLLRLASTASVVTAIVLIVAKLFAWWVSGSVSMMATVIDSMLDAFASLINMVAVYIALKPADEDHHFGHGKAEQLAALAQSAFIAGSAIFLILHAINDLTNDVEIGNEQVAMMVMAFSIVCTLILLVIQNYVIRETGSIAIKADEMHYRMDLITNLSVILALALAAAGYREADAIFGILIALYMLNSVRKVGWESIQMLMDRALPEEELERIEKTILSVEGVQGVHNLRTRISGALPIIQFHLDVQGDLSVRQAHDIGGQVKQAILAWMPEADVTFHLDPN
ncbi:cation diffusion facilitator family transporter [Kistimonas asteriae]|uniref:cation diffusion facilitator family transporter n=1 Tax=Kistimonas asteriae TaxID=517724 RepID=UPI001BA62F03|nr:cation diffusion facilitator family transporter [Kistimonas asteriae]